MRSPSANPVGQLQPGVFLGDDTWRPENDRPIIEPVTPVFVPPQACRCPLCMEDAIVADQPK
jgi:hypothetical protein